MTDIKIDDGCVIHVEKRTFDVSDARHFSLTVALWPGAQMYCLAPRSPLSTLDRPIYWLTN
jgi:hypothetical protein